MNEVIPPLPAPPPVPAAKPSMAREFIDFVKNQGVLGLAVGFIFGAAISDLISSLVSDIIDPVLGLLLGRGKLDAAMLTIGTTNIAWGRFVSSIIDFVVLSVVVFLIIRFFHLQKIEPRVNISRRQF